MSEQFILIAIPYYNHPETLRDVVQRCLKVHGHVLVVDDGSEVEASSLVAGLGVRIERHPKNMGKGEAILTAGRVAKETGASHVVILDADGQHAPEDFPKFKAAIEDDPNALYVGCRDFTADNVPGSSKFGRSFSNFWFRLETGQSLKDCQSGFRAYPTPVLTELKYMFRSYAFEVEVLVRSAWAGLACKDIDINVYYPPEDERVSHFNKLWDNIRLTMLNTHLTGRSITPWPHQRLSIAADRSMTREQITILHPLRSLRRLITENATPVQLATAAFFGIFVGTLPIFFFHTVTTIFMCNFFRANKPFSVSLQQLCMPPIVPAVCIELGFFMRNGRFLTDISIRTLGYQALDRVWEWFLGSLILAPAFGILAAGVVFVIATNMKWAIDAARSRNSTDSGEKAVE